MKMGDIIGMMYGFGVFLFKFKGMCMRMSKKSVSHKYSNMMLRNVYFNVCVELLLPMTMLSYFRHKKYDYERKKFNYKKFKLYFLRYAKMKKSSVSVL